MLVDILSQNIVLQVPFEESSELTINQDYLIDLIDIINPLLMIHKIMALIIMYSRQ